MMNPDLQMDVANDNFIPIEGLKRQKKREKNKNKNNKIKK